jgi:hypothetical protein
LEAASRIDLEAAMINFSLCLDPEEQRSIEEALDDLIAKLKTLPAGDPQVPLLAKMIGGLGDTAAHRSKLRRNQAA